MAVSERQSLPESRSRSRRLRARIFIAGLLSLHLFLFFHVQERIERGYPDFSIFYTAATIVREGRGRQLYDRQTQYQVQQRFAGQIAFRNGPLPYNHPPFEAILFVPLTRLPYPQAFAVWDLLNVIALFGVAWLLRKSVSLIRSLSSWEFVFASLAFFPVFACLLQGQDSILLLLLCVLGYNALKRDADFLAGCWLALGAFKFQLILPIVLLMVIWKRRVVAAGFVAVSMLLVLLSSELTGWEGLLHYPAYVLQVANSPALGGVPSRFIPNLQGLVLGWRLPFLRSVGVGVVLMSSFVLFLFAATRRPFPSQIGKLELQFSLAVIVSGLIGWQTNSHDLSLLLLPLALVGDYCVRTLNRETANKFALLLPALPVLISPLWIVLWLAWGRVNLMAIPLVWWVWKIGKELSREPSLHSSAAVAGEPSG